MATITSSKSAQTSSKTQTILVIGGSGMIGSRITAKRLRVSIKSWLRPDTLRK
jgi:hypothetical protein